MSLPEFDQRDKHDFANVAWDIFKANHGKIVNEVASSSESSHRPGINHMINFGIVLDSRDNGTESAYSNSVIFI